MNRRFHVCYVIPPHILTKLAESDKHREHALRTLALGERFRGRREVRSAFEGLAGVPAGQKRRTIYDTQNQTTLPGSLVRGEGDPTTSDIAVTEAYDFAGATYDFYMTAYNRNSIDGRGMRLDSSVHYDQSFDNAFWDGRQMVYGDGDQTIFDRFTKCLDVVGHELTHGVTAATAALEYHGQSGALNESMSDVFGSLVRQMQSGQTADQADWLIGAGLLLPAIHGVAIRSMKAPGTAYNDPQLGRDPQPANMSDYLNTSDDNGGVHINSGIPNHAFYLAAIAIGGNAWEKAGKIWYVTLTQRLVPSSGFQDAADATFDVAGNLYGPNSPEQKAITDAWNGVGLTPSGSTGSQVTVSSGDASGDTAALATASTKSKTTKPGKKHKHKKKRP